MFIFIDLQYGSCPEGQLLLSFSDINTYPGDEWRLGRTREAITSSPLAGYVRVRMSNGHPAFSVSDRHGPAVAFPHRFTTGLVAQFVTLVLAAGDRPTLANSVKNFDLAQTRNFACPLNRIAHLRHEGIAAYTENLDQEPCSAFAPASNEIAPLQIRFDENQAQSHKRVFQQYPPNSVAECAAASVSFALHSRL